MTFICDLIKRLTKKSSKPLKQAPLTVTPTRVYNPTNTSITPDNIDRFYEANKATMLQHPNSIVVIEANTGRYSFHQDYKSANRFSELKRDQGYTGNLMRLALDKNAKITGPEIDEFKLKYTSIKVVINQK